MTIAVTPPTTILLLSLMLTVAIAASQKYYDPTTRDYTDACNEMAEFAGENFCRVFDICCRDRANNRLNGDRCQLADSTNGCQLAPEGSVEFLRCRAYNCTPEITTTTTTTTTTTYTSFLYSSAISIKAGALVAMIVFVTAFHLIIRQHFY